MFVERMTCAGMKPDSEYTEIHTNRRVTWELGYIAYMYTNGQHDKYVLWQNKNTSLTGYHQHWCMCT